MWQQHGADRMFSTPQFQEHFISGLLQETIGFTGAKMVRRIVGLAHVADIDGIEDDAAREKAQRLALSIGKAAIKHHRKSASIEELIDIAKLYTQ